MSFINDKIEDLTTNTTVQSEIFSKENSSPLSTEKEENIFSSKQERRSKNQNTEQSEIDLTKNIDKTKLPDDLQTIRFNGKRTQQ